MIFKIFKKLLGDGRAWWAFQDFTDNVLNILASPVNDLYSSFKSFLNIHKPTQDLNLYNIQCGEQLFGIKNIPQNLYDRASNVERQWQLLNGAEGFGYIENQLNNAGFNVKLYENIPYQTIQNTVSIQYGNPQYYGFYNGKFAQYGQNSLWIVGNAKINDGGIYHDPVNVIDGKHCFLISVTEPINEKNLNRLSEITAQIKPAETVALVLAKIQG